MTFDWTDLVTLRAVLAHRGITHVERYEHARAETAVSPLIAVQLCSAGIAAVLEIAGSYASDAQSGEWADAAIAAVLASGQERDVVEAAGRVAESALLLDAIASAALRGEVGFSSPSRS
jgi:hypothetical protein